MTPVTPIPEGSVVITPVQMYQEMTAMHQEIRALSALVDPALGDVRGEVKELRAEVDSLKSWRAGIAGALCLLGALVSYGLLSFSHFGG